MRRVAAELGTGTMSLYRYLPGKAELLDLMLDRVQRPSENPADLGDGSWRSALAAMGRATLALYQRHPWLLQVNQSRPILGPSALDGMEKVLTRIKPMGLSDPELVSAIIMIDGYVVGAARTQLYQLDAERRTGLTDTEFWEAQTPMLEKVLASGRFPSWRPWTRTPGAPTSTTSSSACNASWTAWRPSSHAARTRRRDPRASRGRPKDARPATPPASRARRARA